MDTATPLADLFQSLSDHALEDELRLSRSITAATTRMRRLLDEMEAPIDEASTDEIAAAIALLEANGYTVTRR